MTAQPPEWNQQNPPGQPWVPPPPPPPPPGQPWGPPPPGQSVPMGYPGLPVQYVQAGPALPRYDGFSITSMVLGIVSIVIPYFWLVPIPPILAVVFGHLGLRRIRTYGSRGRGMAIAGLVLGYLGIAIAVVFWLAILVSASRTPTYR